MFGQLSNVDIFSEGEFGVVYKGELIRSSSDINTDTVAVKTLNGNTVITALAIHIFEYNFRICADAFDG